MTNFPDLVCQFGNAPVQGRDIHFAGWWSDNNNGNVFFVDYTNGTPNATGKNEMNAPAQHLQRAIDAAGTDATIYLRPREFASGTYGEDPQQITPATVDAENFHIDKTKDHMSIIGCGKGLSHASAHKAWIGGYSGLTTPVLDIRAPGCVIENLRAQPPSSAATGIFHSANDGSTYDGGNTTFVNNDFHSANTTGGINLCSTWQMAIIGNRFVDCDVGIYITSSYSQPQIIEVAYNIFSGESSEVYCNVYAVGGARRFTAHHNIHSAEQPAAGGQNKYYSFAATSTGIIAGDYFGVYSQTGENLCTLNGINLAGCFSTQGIVAEAS